MRHRNSTRGMALGLVGLVVAWGCGTEPTLPIAVTVSPPTVSVVAGGSQGFSATVDNDPAGKGVTWSITGCTSGVAACGSLTSVGSTTATYTAPTPIPTDAHLGIIATSVADNTKSSTATVSIVAIGVSVSPSNVNVLAGGSQDFAVTVANDPSSAGVTWSITGCTGGAEACGSLTNVTSTAATYTAPTPVPSDAHLGVTAISVADNTKSSTAVVAIVATGAGGGQIASISTRDGNYEIYVMSADGSGLVNLTNDRAEDTDPVWSPDGSRIAFVRADYSANPGPVGVFVMNGDGSYQVNIVPGTGSDQNYSPAWSPDGTKIAFVSNRDGNQEIYSVNADGSGLVNLSSDAANDWSPAWSPDGSKLAFVSDRGGAGRDIYLMKADGTGLVNLTRNPSYYDTPAWSPDGSRIAFISYGGVFLMNADGSGVTRLSDSSATSTWSPLWSPDGTRIAFVRGNSFFRCMPPCPPLFRTIYVVNADGRNLLRLTPTQAGLINADPFWSPDGTKIAFVSNRDGNQEIYVMGADGSAQVNLTNSPSYDVSPVWRPK